MTRPIGDPRGASRGAKGVLVERARAGDHDAFAILAKESFGPMYGAAKLILRDQHRAEDAVQEALLVAWRRIATIRDPDAWDAWLYRLTVRACYQQAKAPGAHDVAETSATAPEPDFTQRVADHDRIMAGLSALSLDQRAVVVLHFYLDLPLVHVAAVLGVPVGTAKSRLHRALDALRAGYGDEADHVAPALRERRA